MNIVIMGAHPDDPESGCGGLAIQAVQAGHRVICLYLSSGVIGWRVGGRLVTEIREKEGEAACAMIGAEPHFLRFPDTDIPFNQAAVAKVSDFLRQMDADVVLAHWPVDTHPDHQAVGALATQSVVGNPEVALAYYEVETGGQTLAFTPNRYVDVTAVAVMKKKAVECHVSQEVESWWHYHDLAEKVHGLQLGVERAEGYYLVVSTPKAESLFSVRNFIAPSGARVQRKTKHENIPLCPKFF
jgi:LmbE family N-acetylglucosaminyl deacetylase